MTDIVENTAAKPRRRRSPSRAQARAGSQGLINLINLVLIFFTIRDIRRRSEEELNGKRKLWMLVALASPIGPIAYFIYIRRRRTLATEIPLEIVE